MSVEALSYKEQDSINNNHQGPRKFVLSQQHPQQEKEHSDQRSQEREEEDTPKSRKQHSKRFRSGKEFNPTHYARSPTRSNKSVKYTPKKSTISCQSLVEQIFCTVRDLECTLVEDHRHDFQLRLALERQTEKMQDLSSSLETERQRNQRLVQLIRGVDSSSSTEDEIENTLHHGSGPGLTSGFDKGLWQSRSSMDAFESISPLLMQQRYDELSLSHKQCRRQLVKKEKLLTLVKCEKVELQAKYDHLVDEYRSVQKRFEALCCKYLRLQSKKNHEIQKLRDALTFASDCVINAQQIMDFGDENNDPRQREFRQNLQLFIKALRLCEWVQGNDSRTSVKTRLNSNLR